MFDPVLLTVWLLPLAALSGWYVARRTTSKPTATSHGRLSSDYLRGLNHLVNDEPDRAIEVFVRVLDVDNDTVETHMAMGNLFRRRGEVERALRIHQNLVARKNIKSRFRNQARFEAAQDYLQAGMLDRAEDLGLELVKQGVFLQPALEHLIKIYEKEREWSRAMETSQRWESISGQSRHPIKAHYLCELSEEARQAGNEARARKYLRNAIAEDRNCARASILLGALEQGKENWEAAIQAYRRVLWQDQNYLTEVLEPLERCYDAIGNPEALREFLEEAAYRYEGAAPRIALARLLNDLHRPEEAARELSEYLQLTPNWAGFYYLVQLTGTADNEPLSGPLQSLRTTLGRMIDKAAHYQCTHCGFSERVLQWQCPRCGRWGSITPLKDLVQMAH